MNGHFIFEDIEEARAPPLETILRTLPIVANPSLTVDAEQTAERLGTDSKVLFKDKVYFEVRRGGSDGEYLVIPLRTFNITGISRYTMARNKLPDFEINAVWSDFIEAHLGLREVRNVICLYFRPYEST